jgi:hypothetical protein
MERKKSVISTNPSATDTLSIDYRNGNQLEKAKLSYGWALKSMKIITRIVTKESGKNRMQAIRINIKLQNKIKYF